MLSTTNRQHSAVKKIQKTWVPPFIGWMTLSESFILLKTCFPFSVFLVLQPRHSPDEYVPYIVILNITIPPPTSTTNMFLLVLVYNAQTHV